MTKDLALITTLSNPVVLNSQDFIKAIRSTLEAMLQEKKALANLLSAKWQGLLYVIIPAQR